MAEKIQKDTKIKETDKIEDKSILQYAVGRRKRSVARVRMYKGDGKVTVNGKDLKDFLTTDFHAKEFLRPLEVAGVKDDYDFTVKVVGGGTTGQLGAMKHGVARCIAKVNDDLKLTMRQGGFLTRDPREKERKKVYRLGARRAPQFSKR